MFSDSVIRLLLRKRFSSWKRKRFSSLLLSQLTCVCAVCPLGGAPNYYPNSFSAPEVQPQCVESKFKVYPDVARYNSSDEDNVTQVEKKMFIRSHSFHLV